MFPVVRTWLMIASLATLVTFTPRGHAYDKQACIDDHRLSQVLRRDRKLRAVRLKLTACAQSACPPLLRADCAKWLADVESEESTVTFSVTMEGAPTNDVRVFVDGEPLVDALDGQTIAVDPGSHLFRYESRARVREERVTILSGEKARVLRVAFDTDRTSARSGRVSPLVIALGAVGLTGIASFGTFGMVGQLHESRLADQCKPNCSERDMSALTREYAAADISLAVGVVALGLAVWLGLASSRSPHSGAGPARAAAFSF